MQLRANDNQTNTLKPAMMSKELNAISTSIGTVKLWPLSDKCQHDTPSPYPRHAVIRGDETWVGAADSYVGYAILTKYVTPVSNTEQKDPGN
jgi:hypothetical protein